MQPYQQRVVDEKAALDEKLQKLGDFFGTEAFLSLSDVDRALLTRQDLLMQQYSSVLRQRIARFPVETKS